MPPPACQSTSGTDWCTATSASGTATATPAAATAAPPPPGSSAVWPPPPPPPPPPPAPRPRCYPWLWLLLPALAKFKIVPDWVACETIPVPETVTAVPGDTVTTSTGRCGERRSTPSHTHFDTTFVWSKLRGTGYDYHFNIDSHSGRRWQR